MIHNHPYTERTRVHYILRLGNAELATKTCSSAPNRWHNLSPQHIWSLPKYLTQVNVRKDSEADIEVTRVTAYIWFFCNCHGGPDHFIQVGITRHHLGQDPVKASKLPIPEDIIARLNQGFGHWSEWLPVTPQAAFQDQVRPQPILPCPWIPNPHLIAKHPSLPTMQQLIDFEEKQKEATTTALPGAPPPRSFIKFDIENSYCERAQPHSQGYLYLIRIENTSMYTIGMSLDPEIRLQTLQAATPFPLCLLKTQGVQDMRSAEIILHRQFECQEVPHLNSISRWYNLGNDVDAVQTAFATTIRYAMILQLLTNDGYQYL